MRFQGPGLLYRHVGYSSYGPCLDQKTHAFWVSEALRFGPQVQIDDAADPIFPLWTFFALNSEPQVTKKLSQAMKQEALAGVLANKDYFQFEKVLTK
jgi:hypothetical protein